ncbi:MAG: helix-turn-helix domain-containing protein [Acidobacteriota bacterium]
MSPRNAQASTLMRRASRAKLLAGSLQVFAERGYAATSMAQIAHHCGVSKGLAYHYFDSKEALLEAALREHLETLLKLTGQIERTADPARRLESLIDGLVAYVREEPAAFRLYLSLILQAPAGLVEDTLEKLREPLDLYLGQVHRLFVDLGATDPQTDAALFRSALLGVCVRVAMGDEQLPTAALRARLLEAFI